MVVRTNPFMHYVEDLEKEAEKFLTRYNCEDAIDEPQPIPIREIATKLMSLEIIDSEYLSSDGSVQGAIAFTKGIIEVFDWSEEQTVGYQVQGPSIFIDADIFNSGRFNNTLAHECYHWWAHRNYFNFKRTHEPGSEFAFRCNRTSAVRGNLTTNQWSDIDRMEWQAKTIAPKILMPRNAFKKKVDSTYQLLLAGWDTEDKRRVTSSVIDVLADFFEVSKQSAAIRMYELGYSEAEEFCGETNSGRRPSRKNRVASNAKYRQKPITLNQAFELYRKNDLLRSLLDTGAFQFVDGYFVLRDEKYICLSQDGEITLTEYAKNHLVECVLDFSVKLIPDSLMHGYYAMFRADSIFREEPTLDSTTQNTELFNKAKEFEKKFKRAESKAVTPAQWMKERMDEEHWYESTFEEKTGLDKMNYSRVQSGKHKFTLKPLIAMGVGLGLDIKEMEEVLSCGGMTFIDGNREHEAYKFLFTSCYGKGIDYCNSFLESVGVETLGTKQRL